MEMSLIPEARLTPLSHDGLDGRQLRVWHDPPPSPTRVAVHLAGDLDLVSGPVLEAELDSLAQHSFDRVDLYLRHVGFCDCAGLNALLMSRRLVAERHGSVQLHDPCASLEVLLDVLDLTTSLEPRSGAQPSPMSSSPGMLMQRRSEE